MAIEGKFHLRYRDLVGFVCAVHEETHQSGGVRSIPFGPKLFVGVVVGDCVQILGGAWAIRLDQLSLGFGDSPACVVLR